MMKKLVKTIDEYACDLLMIAPPDIVQTFFEYMAKGNRVQAIKILRDYNLIELKDVIS